MMDQGPSNAGHGRVQWACHAAVRYRKGWDCARSWLPTLEFRLSTLKRGYVVNMKGRLLGTVR